MSIKSAKSQDQLEKANEKNMSDLNITLQDIIIDDEFKRLLPPLDAKTYLSLEQSILDYGCMNPLVLWNNVLIDGYNRYEILTKHDLPFNTTSLEFGSRDEAIIWIISTQVSRRNLTTMQLTYFRGLHYNTEKKLHGGDRHSNKNSSAQNEHLNEKTADKLSKQYKVAPVTIRRDGEIAEVIAAIGKESPEAKREILSGNAYITRKQLRDMASNSNEDIKTTASKIATGTFEPANKFKSNRSDNLPLSAAVLSEAYKFIANIRHAPDNDPAEIKKIIKEFIKQLETIYRQIG